MVFAGAGHRRGGSILRDIDPLSRASRGRRHGSMNIEVPFILRPIMPTLRSIVDALDRLFDIDALAADPGFSRFIPMVYDPIGENWRERFEPGFVARFNGLMIRGDDEVRHVHCASFPSGDILEAFLAAASPGDLFFSHHPLDMQCGDPRGEPGRGFVPIAAEHLDAIAARRLSFYACHAPMDYNRTIGTTVSMVQAIDGTPVADFYPYGNGFAGIICDIPPISTAELTGALEAIYAIPYVDAGGIHHDAIRRVAVVAGCGDAVGPMREAEALGAHAYVTGEIHCHIDNDYGRAKYAQVMDYIATSRMSFIGVSHAASEHLVMERQMVPWFRTHCGVDTSAIAMRKWWR